VSRAQRKRDRTAAVLSDCRVDWNLPGVRPLGPDLAVFTGVARDEGWETFDVRAEGARPLLVTEVTSRATEKNDLGPKVGFYHRAGVPVYVIVKASGRGRQRRLELIGYRHAPGGYERIEPDDQGRIYLEALGVWLGKKRDPRGGYERVVCFKVRTGEEIGDLAAQMTRRARAERRAKAEARRAEAEARRAEAEASARAEAERRIRELEAALKRPGGRGS
jgi:colicin import membrane protein